MVNFSLCGASTNDKINLLKIEMFVHFKKTLEVGSSLGGYGDQILSPYLNASR